MTLKEKIFSQLNQSLKEGEKLTTSVLRMLSAAIVNKEKEKRYKLTKAEPGLTEKELVKKSELGDEEIIEIIFSEIKKREEASSEFEKGKRMDLAEKEKKEIEILKKYLPEQLSEEEIEGLIKEAIAKTGAIELKDMGKVMGASAKKFAGKADNKIISSIVKEILGA